MHAKCERRSSVACDGGHTLRGILVALACGLAALSMTVTVHAAQHRQSGGTHSQQKSTIDWSTHDTAVYVVSTVNLLRNKAGRPIGGQLRRRLSVRKYNVYADSAVPDLYYIDLLKSDGTLVGSLAYKMGWVRPMSLSSAFDAMGVTHATDSIASGYKVDRKTLIGSFGSTLPR